MEAVGTKTVVDEYNERETYFRRVRKIQGRRSRSQRGFLESVCALQYVVF
jgi:hypothetical protein